MRKLLLTAAVLLPFSALGDHLDVIQFKLNEGCTLATYRAIVKDFNDQWGAKHAYHGEIAVPVQSPDLESYYWIGRSADATSFGKAWDAWRNESSYAGSVAGKLVARFAECSTNIGRRGYDTY
jgi:hypothetical protein